MKNKFSKLLLSAVLLGFVSTACSPTSDKLNPRPDYSKPAKKEDLGEYIAFNPNVDILFIIDNSGSMMSYQTSLTSNIQTFIDGISQNQLLEYNIGVITTDNSHLQGIPNVVTKNTPNMKAVLQRNLLPGSGGSGWEKFFDIIADALSPASLQSFNKGFYRSDALLAIVFLTDTEDQGVMDGPSLYRELVNMKGGDASKIAIYGVVIPPGETRCYRDDPSAGRLDAFFNLSKAVLLNLCDPDYGTGLLKIGNDITEKASLTIPLRQVPVVSTIKLTYGSQIIPADRKKGWSYDPEKNAIILGKDLELKDEPKGTKIEVTFVPADLTN